MLRGAQVHYWTAALLVDSVTWHFRQCAENDSRLYNNHASAKYCSVICLITLQINALCIDIFEKGIRFYAIRKHVPRYRNGED